MIGALKSHLTILQVILPLMSAVVCSLLRGRVALAQTVSFGAVLASFLISLALFVQVGNGGPITYKVGGWGSPYGIELRVDLLSATMLLLVGFIGIMSVIYGIYPSRRELSSDRVPRFYAAFLLAFGGMLGILVSHDVFNVYVFLEIASISSYVLVAIGGDKRSVASAFEYLVMGTVGATFYLIGIGFLYAATGTLNMGDMFTVLQDIPINRAIQAGILCVILGLVMKAALFPFHGWMIKAYSTAPAFVIVFLSGIAAKVMVYLVIRVVYSVFGARLVFTELPFGTALLTLAALATVLTSIVAAMSKDMRGVLAYSSAANVGCIILAVCINTYSGLAAAVAYMVNHSIVKSALFMVSGGIAYHFDDNKVGSKYLSLSRALPHITSAFVLLALSLVGMPPTVGFVAKWHMLSSFMDARAFTGLIVLSVGSVCSVIYTWRVVEHLYFSSQAAEACANDIALKTPRMMTLCIWVMAFFGFIAGAYPLPLTSVSEQIAADLLLHSNSSLL
ncbi:proton-conducting transporter transmembrane domain-containing protein [Anaplasma capra]|uniref:proton-conducting transporter transmembrane domain-containing protein n=1 Tax=Anaplasma capra TaxID=1562740 RepID=UPI0021D5BEE3|nr:proton-conducting transporter membrane subunit [Anaplasma capra]MCU7611252.1 proton-conducting transporter membrane subunit [Anaplasma capra]MCU7612624.1 proton-conducting transporter membrane subunit [Anaplasma capra]